MKQLSEIIVPNDKKYTAEHIWFYKDADNYVLGISDFAQDQLGEIVYIDMPEVGDEFDANDSFGEIESVKSVNKLYMPFKGKVIAVNEELESSPTLINISCYEKAWIIRINADSSIDEESFLSAEDYMEILNK